MQNDTISSRINNLRDPASLRIRSRVKEVSGLPIPLLISGETGTGKDTWVRYLAEYHRAPGLVEIHCGDLSPELIESVWYGHRKGAFTGASSHQSGRFSQAGRGILFFNQIDLLPPGIQGKLLRTIERRRFYPLGSEEDLPLKAKLVFVSGPGIAEKVHRGEFRSDLFYAISAVHIDLPPLRERKKDIVSLFHFFCRDKELEIHLSPRGWEDIRHHPWYGNIRELENFVNRIAISGRAVKDSDTHRLSLNSGAFYDQYRDRELSLREFERKYIRYLLQKYRNKSRVARILGISRKSLYNRIEKE